MNLTDTPEENPYRSDLDKYIYSILEMLKDREIPPHHINEAQRLHEGVKFSYWECEFDDDGLFNTSMQPFYCIIPYTELTEAMESNTLPKQIIDLL